MERLRGRLSSTNVALSSSLGTWTRSKGLLFFSQQTMNAALRWARAPARCLRLTSHVGRPLNVGAMFLIMSDEAEGCRYMRGDGLSDRHRAGKRKMFGLCGSWEGRVG